MNISSNPSITAVILAGGKARRMGGDDKGLLLYQQQPLIQYAIDVLRKQVDSLIINANRNIEQYQTFGYPVISDSIDGFCGPLAGMLTAIQSVDTDYILTAPCDSPNISSQLRQRMMETLLGEQADIAVAHDGERLQPVFCLIPCRLEEELADFLEQGGRKIDLWLSQYKLAIVDFSDQADSFINFNHPDDIIAHSMIIQAPVPILGFAAFSGTGKTTLLRQLIPKLKEKNITVAVIKHAHHRFDIDIPGKDSYEIRQAGANQVLVSSNRLMALMEVQTNDSHDPRLADLIPRLNCTNIDLILVEGFKHETIPKIELYRPSLAKPLLHPDDDSIIAIASDEIVTTKIEQLNLNNIDEIAVYIQQFIIKG
ncbi:MAG: molybdenum cofactor guanylyltransferase MobA [Piscirickettsiaceae bacterium]|nr:molybdenum cofactor guanylyltransferase MobA [Piscirickettsiaceae bacterium]